MRKTDNTDRIHQLIIAIGTNVDHELNITLIKRALLILLPDIIFTSEKWTNSTENESVKYMNCMAMATTRHGVKQIIRAFKQIERKCGDTKGKRSKGIITADIDLLKFDNDLYHKEDWQHDYIKSFIRELNGIKRSIQTESDL